MNHTLKLKIDCTPALEAMKQGYIVGLPDDPEPTLVSLCKKLGPNFHLVTIDGGNSIHTVLSGGGDIEIFRDRCVRGEKYTIALAEKHGLQRTEYIFDVPREEVWDRVTDLIFWRCFKRMGEQKEAASQGAVN